MNNKNSQQLTPYNTKIYFVPDTKAIDQRNNQLNAVYAQLNPINTQANVQLNRVNNQLNALNSQVNAINAEENFIRNLKFRGLQLLIINFIHSIGLAITYPSIKFYSLINLDLRWCYLFYFILLLIEAYLVNKYKRTKYFYICLILWIFFFSIYSNFLVKMQNTETAMSFFYLCAIFHIYPLYIGISLAYTAIQKKNKNLKEAQQKIEQQKKLEQEKSQIKEEQRKKIQQIKREINALQQKKIDQTLPPTDQEFDAWLESRVKGMLTTTLHKLGLDDKIANHRDLLRVRGYVLPGMKDARHYRVQDLRYKLGVDGKRRYSLNLYTYFYPDDHQIMVFTYEINAMNWDDGRETTKEYFYHDVIGAETVDDHDKLYIDGQPHKYRTQIFRLKLCDGTAISATVHSRPLEDMINLPVFDMVQSDIDKTIAQLRMLLRTKKHGAQYP